MRSIVQVLFVSILLMGCKAKSTSVETETNAEAATVHWLTLEEAQSKMKLMPKKVLVDVYATWCGPCIKMAKYTFTDPAVVEYINQNFYAVKFNTESKAPVDFLGKTYYNKKITHDLTSVIGAVNGRISYPTIAYFDENFKRLQAIPGYYDAEDFLVNTKFFGDNIFNTLTYQQYLQSLENTSK